MSSLRLFSLVSAGVLSAGIVASGQTSEIFTAQAVRAESRGELSVDVTLAVDRYTTAEEHTAVIAALKDGTSALHRLLAMSPAIGSIVVNDRRVSLKYVYKRHNGRISLLANEPLAFLDPGSNQDKSKSGYDFTLAILDFSLPGIGAGEIDPAVNVAVNSTGQIITQGYGAKAIRLTNVKRK